MGNKIFKTKKKNIEITANKRNKREKCLIKHGTVKVTVYDGSGNIRYDVTPKYSYIHNGVPGGWYI